MGGPAGGGGARHIFQKFVETSRNYHFLTICFVIRKGVGENVTDLKGRVSPNNVTNAKGGGGGLR